MNWKEAKQNYVRELWWMAQRLSSQGHQRRHCQWYSWKLWCTYKVAWLHSPDKESGNLYWDSVKVFLNGDKENVLQWNSRSIFCACNTYIKYFDSLQLLTTTYFFQIQLHIQLNRVIVEVVGHLELQVGLP